VTEPRLSVVIVTWNSVGELGRTLPALVDQLRDGDELIVADNASEDGTPGLVAELTPAAQLIPTGGNRGFGAAANEGANAASGDLLLLLNPDVTPRPGFRDAIVKPWVEHRGWGHGWASSRRMMGGRSTRPATPVHFTGFAWAGHHGDPPDSVQVGEVSTLSGACLAIPLETFRRLDGFPERYFLCHEDVDLSLRLRLEGARLGIEPTAIVDHEYEFEGPQKMRRLEANRSSVIVRTFPSPLFLLLLPALFLTELALIPISIAGGWGGQKLRAQLDRFRRLTWNLRTRGEIQTRRTISAGEFAALLTADLDSPFFGRAGRSRLIQGALRAYWRIVRALLR
jgi:GT2 family glycosyltransferase